MLATVLFPLASAVLAILSTVALRLAAPGAVCGQYQWPAAPAGVLRTGRRGEQDRVYPHRDIARAISPALYCAQLLPPVLDAPAYLVAGSLAGVFVHVREKKPEMYTIRSAVSRGACAAVRCARAWRSPRCGRAEIFATTPPKRAKALWDRFDFVYTPKHGGWLNMAAIDLSVMIGQFLNRRIASIETLREEVAAWQLQRDQKRAKINWQFTTDSARIKLKRLYPKFQE